MDSRLKHSGMKYMDGRILVLGASGYIGSRLVAVLLEKGYHLRAAGRSLAKLEKCPWARHQRVELVETNILDKQSLQKACGSCEVVYYLVHSMNPYTKDFAQADRQAAQNMVETASQTAVQRIIYLGGLGEEEKALSKHLRSRMEVLHILHSGKVPVTSFRAAMIIGHGSISFEILRCLVNRLNVIIAPSWVSTESQPIAVSNVIHYLVECLGSKQTIGQVFDIGGPDILSYRQLMGLYAKEAHLKKRLIVPVSFPIPSFLLTRFMSPYPAYIAGPLLDGLKNKVVCQDNRIRGIIPQKLLDCRESIQAAIK
jgi:uncharacterized protein YbjT (DUF2867 family)